MTPAQARANVRRMYVWQFLTSMHFFGGVLVPFFTDWGGISFAQVMWLQTWFVFWIFILEVPTGAVADHWGRRTSLLCASVCLFAAVLVYASGKGLSRFLLAEFLWACATAFSSGAEDSMVYDSLKSAGLEGEAKSALARMSSFQIGAIAVAAPLGSLMAARWGLRAPLVAGALPFVLSLAAGLTLREPPGEPHERKRYREVLTRGVRYFLSHASLRRLAFDSVTIWVFSFMTIWLFQPRLRELGIPLAWFGFVTAASTLTQVLILSNIDQVERAFGGPRRYLALTALIPAFGYLIVSFADSPWWSTPFFVLIPAVGLSRAVLAGNYMNRHVGSNMRATVLSSVGMSRQLLTGLIYPLVGWGAQRSIPATFGALGLATLACALLTPLRQSDLD